MNEIPLKIIGCVLNGMHKAADDDSICYNCGYTYTYGQHEAAKRKIIDLAMKELIDAFGELETVTLIKAWMNR